MAHSTGDVFKAGVDPADLVHKYGGSTSVPVSELRGVGAKTDAALRAIGIASVHDLALWTAQIRAVKGGHESEGVALARRFCAAAQRAVELLGDGRGRSDGAAVSSDDAAATRGVVRDPALGRDGAGSASGSGSGDGHPSKDAEADDDGDDLGLTAALAKLSIGEGVTAPLDVTSGAADEVSAARDALRAACRAGDAVGSLRGAAVQRTEAEWIADTLEAADDMAGLSDAAARHGSSRSKHDALAAFLHEQGAVEVESLASAAPSGACQFSSVAEQLLPRRPCADGFRPDRVLRHMVCAHIEANAADFQPFLVPAASRTRRQHGAGGDAVDMGDYLRRMRVDTTDGDHVTLQALANTTGATIRVFKWTGGGTGRARGTAEGAVPFTLLQTEPSHSSAHEAEGVECGDPTCLGLHGVTLWLTLRGEAHFRSLHKRSKVEVEAE